MDKVVLTPWQGKGAELCSLLRKELGIPDSVTWFEVRFARDEVITVTCEYITKCDADESNG